MQFSGHAWRLLLCLCSLVIGRPGKGIRCGLGYTPQDAVQYRAPDYHKGNKEQQLYNGSKHLFCLRGCFRQPLVNTLLLSLLRSRSGDIRLYLFSHCLQHRGCFLRVWAAGLQLQVFVQSS
jgi:hypothetical protein